jgi:hypothetical protein
LESYFGQFALTLFGDQFSSAPPGSFHAREDVWSSFHEKLEQTFSNEPFCTLNPVCQEWHDKNEKFLIYLPGYLPPQLQFSMEPYLKPAPPAPMANRRFPLSGSSGVHHGFHSYLSPAGLQWKLFHTTNKAFLKRCKQLLFYADSLYRLLAPETWEHSHHRTPQGYGLFDTIWTTVVVNCGAGAWHYDPLDVGFAALFYFGDFQEGSVRLATPFNLDIPVQPKDIVFLNSSKIYHKSMPFTGTRINLTMYCTKIQKKPYLFLPEELEFRKK